MSLLSRRNYALQLATGSFQGCERFALVDELAPVRFLSREEFDALKKLNPRLIEMRAGDIHYLTEPPSKS
jgi:hypothetical protein